MWTEFNGEIPSGLGASPTFYKGRWLARRDGDSKVMATLGAATDPTLLAAANAAYLVVSNQPDQSGCVPNSAFMAYQKAYNVVYGAGMLTEDGKYGSATNTALLSDTGNGAIAGLVLCGGSGGGGTSPTNTNPSQNTTPSQTTIVTATPPTTNTAATVAVVGVLGVVAYGAWHYLKKGKHGRR